MYLELVDESSFLDRRMGRKTPPHAHGEGSGKRGGVIRKRYSGYINKYGSYGWRLGHNGNPKFDPKISVENQALSEKAGLIFFYVASFSSTNSRCRRILVDMDLEVELGAPSFDIYRISSLCFPLRRVVRYLEILAAIILNP